MSAYAIRLARADEVEDLRRIEDAAGELYAEAGLPGDLEGLAPREISIGIDARAAWVAVSAAQELVGFALCWPRADALHLRELDVTPTHMRRGLGRRLVEHVCAQAHERGASRVTLTTFRDIPWNAPLYRRWGFEVLAPAQLPAWLVEIRAREDASVLGRWPRVAMGRAVRVVGAEPHEGKSKLL